MWRSISARFIESSGFAGLALLLATLAAPGARADTEVGGYILEDTTWDAAGSPYVVIDSLIIAGDATLTIEPGVEVRVRHGLGLAVGDEVEGAGTLVARGTDLSRILFTSNDPYDDEHPNPAEPGDWVSIEFTDYAVDAVYDNGEYQSGSILEYVVVEYAGGGQAAVKVYDSSPYLAHCEVRHNADSGIYVYAPQAPPIRIEECGIHHNMARYGAGAYVGYSPSATLSGNTISANTAEVVGGGLYLDDCDAATLSGNTIFGNAARAGAGVELNDCYGATLSGNTITGNTAESHGGGLYLDECWHTTLTGNTISGNTASDRGGNGGGLYLSSCDAATLSGNTISGNTADWGGGGVCVGDSDGATLAGNTITGNTATPGAGVALEQCLHATLTANTISDNTGNGAGGGLHLECCFYATLTGNMISGNTAAWGAGVYLYYRNGATLSGNTITENTADDEGGAIYLSDADDATLSSNRITGNHTLTGQTGGVYVTFYTNRLSLAGDPNTPHFNLISGNDGYQLYNGNPFDADGDNDIDARWVVWCTDDPNAIDTGIYDFFDDTSKAIVDWVPFFEWLPGDLNADWSVDVSDLAILLSNYRMPSGAVYEDGDLDGDGDVDLADLAALLAVYGTACP